MTSSAPSLFSTPGSAKPSTGKKRTSQGFFTMWHGLTWPVWRAMLAQSPPLSTSYLPRRATIQAIALSNSFWATMERAVYGNRIRQTQIEHPPIFVLGHWRSGTTLLHNLLTLDKNLTFPNLYHTIFPQHFLLTEKVMSTLSGPLLPKTRPMDNVPTGWKMPQEDEIALAVTTLVSPYMMLVYQGMPQKYWRFFDLTECSPEEVASWKESFLTLAKKLTILQNKPIVFKSPSHTFRVPLFLEMFPNAKFVYIYRDPYAVMNSSIHLRKTMFTENAISEPNFVGLEDDTLACYEKCIRRYETTKSLIPPENLYEIRFEDLEQDPLGHMQSIYQGLKLPGWSQMATEIEAILPELQQYKKNEFRMDPVLQRKYYDRMKFAFDLYGYPSRL